MDWKEIARIYKSTSPQLKRNVKPAKEGNSFRFQLKLCLSILPLNILQKYYCSATGDGMDYSRWHIFLFQFVAHSFFLKHTNLVGEDNDDPGVELENREE